MGGGGALTTIRLTTRWQVPACLTTRWQVLAGLATHGPSTMGALRDEMASTTGAVAAVLAKMEARRLVERAGRAQMPSSDRIWRWSTLWAITGAGRALLGTMDGSAAERLDSARQDDPPADPPVCNVRLVQQALTARSAIEMAWAGAAP